METEETVKEGVVATMSRAKRLWLTFADIVLFVVLSTIFLFLFTIPLSFAFPGLEEQADDAGVFLMMLSEAAMLAGALIAAFLVLRSRKLPFSGLGLSSKGWGRGLLRGLLFVLCLYAVGFGLSLLLGAVEVEGVSFSPAFLLSSLLLYFLVAVTEEVIARGFILGRMLDGGVNKYAALFVSAVLFSLMHLFNPGFALVPFLNIVLAGCFLGASYIYTRNLCFPIALHWFWNWMQGPVLGYKVSGNDFGDGNLLILRLPEENLINGGAFGFEGSILCSLLLVLGTVAVFKLKIKN